MPDATQQVRADAAAVGPNSVILADRLGLRLPGDLARFIDQPPVDDALQGLLYRIVAPYTAPPSLLWAFALLRRASQRAPLELVPVAPVDDRSLACVVCARTRAPLPADFGSVVRWHLDDVPARAQRALLDVDLASYLETYRTEVLTREEGVERFNAKVEEYAAGYGDKTPRAHEPRPIRKACQNVVIGQGNWCHDGAFNGLSVNAWQTCQVPHVAAHEGNRGLLASTLAEAFRAGGTMEVRFDDHLERQVPASLRQYGRVVGCEPGKLDKRAIVPAEARELMLALTPMPARLRGVVDRLVARGTLTPERVCYLLLAGTWKPIELDFLLSCSTRSISMLSGGVEPLDRVDRQAELALGRAAVALGMLHARLSLPRQAEPDEEGLALVLEDQRSHIAWTIDAETATVRFEGPELASARTPWGGPACDRTLTVVPRSHPSAEDVRLLERLSAAAPAALVLPADAEPAPGASEYGVMHCPDRINALDRIVEARLHAARVGRA